MNIHVPIQLTHSLFFPFETIEISSEQIFFNDLHFQPELLYYHHLSDHTPWEDPEIHVPILVKQWYQLQRKLVTLLKARSREIERDMLEGIQIYFTLLFWSNKKPVQLYEWQKQVKLLDIKAINIEERLEFILSRHRTYPAFIQLSELITEQHKHYARKCAINKYKQK